MHLLFICCSNFVDDSFTQLFIPITVDQLIPIIRLSTFGMFVFYN